MSARTKSNGLVYLRRSDGKQETSLEKQLDWALSEAHKLGVKVDATMAELAYMQANGLNVYKSIRLDNAITGADLTRPGLKALIEDAGNDRSCSHIFVFKRDRLGRPDSPVEMMLIEETLRRQGITFVRSDGITRPAENESSDLPEKVMMLFEYHRSGQFLKDLSEQMIRTQLHLAKKGRWTGGNPPYGFARVLVDEQGNRIEELTPGKYVRQAGCHVVIVPKDERKIATWIQILTWRGEGWGIKRIARRLNQLGIPSPDAGRTRTDHGVKHEVSGRWTMTTVRALCLNKAIIGLLEYGKFSEGKHRRLGLDGPRELDKNDRGKDKQPKRRMNDRSLMVTSKMPIEPCFDVDRWEEIQAETTRRGRTQRGIPRPRDPARYPLSCRVTDLSDNCGATMYGRANGKRLIYCCGNYMATGGAECKNNTVDAEALLQFTLKTLVELVERHGAREKLRAKLLDRARGEQRPDPLRPVREDARRNLTAQIKELDGQMQTAQRNMAIEKDDEIRAAIREEYMRIKGELTEARRQLDTIPVPEADSVSSPEQEVELAMRLFDEIRLVATDGNARAQILPLLERLQMKIGLRFVDGLKGPKRHVRRLAGGVIAFGDDPFSKLPSSPPALGDPVNDSLGAPSRDGAVRQRTKSISTEKAASGSLLRLSDAAHFETRQQEGVSFTKVSRGDRT